jgi:hypothetical protein
MLSGIQKLDTVQLSDGTLTMVENVPHGDDATLRWHRFADHAGLMPVCDRRY